MKARTAGTVLGALAVFLVTACGGSSTSTLAPVKATSAPPATASPGPGPNASVCRHFETIIVRLGVVLAAARARPASITTGERNELLHDARLMDRWSNTAAAVVSGNQFGTLPLDFRGASAATHLLATGYHSPSAANYVRGAVSAVARVVSDCTGGTGNLGG